MTQADVLVIGAGPAGIATAYALEQAGITYKVVDKSYQIGDTWNRLYPSLTLNTTRYFSHMPGAPFPAHYGIFPTARQYHDYLLDFVKRHDFNIQLGVEVKRVTPEKGQWRVETSEGIWHYPVVISATGIFGSPIMPDIPGMVDFAGEIIHAHDFTDPAQLRGKRVLVVGNGPSGIDISVAAAEVAAAVAIAIRSGVTLKRRYPFGLPHHTWLMLAENLPNGWCKAIMKFVGRWGFPEQERYRLNKPTPGSGGITAYQGPELLEVVKAGKVKPMPEPIHFENCYAEFSDGSRAPYDVVIMATGYVPVLHQYLDIDMQYSDEPFRPQSPCDWQNGQNGVRGFPLRDTSQHPNGRQILGHPGLYLVGTFYKGKGAMYNFNVEAKIAAEQIKTYLAASKSP